MVDINIGRHTSQQYNAELEDIRGKVLKMGGLVEEQLVNALTAIVDGDSQLGEAVMTNDFKINALEVQIDEECNHILVRRQPAATDLRFVIAVIKTAPLPGLPGNRSRRPPGTGSSSGRSAA